MTAAEPVTARSVLRRRAMWLRSVQAAPAVAVTVLAAATAARAEACADRSGVLRTASRGQAIAAVLAAALALLLQDGISVITDHSR